MYFQGNTRQISIYVCIYSYIYAHTDKYDLIREKKMRTFEPSGCLFPNVRTLNLTPNDIPNSNPSLQAVIVCLQKDAALVEVEKHNHQKGQPALT